MLRRFLAPASAQSMAGVMVAAFATTRPSLVEQDPVEREREKELRKQVLQKYKGMEVPEMTNFEYGNFSTGGIQAAAAQQAFRSQGFSNVFGMSGSSARSSGGKGYCNNGSCEAGVGGMPSGMPNMDPAILKVDWLMLLTGAALMFLSGKLLFNQITRGVDDLDFPLWTASLEVQAKHLIFCVQFDNKMREDLRRDFQHVRQANPFADFFEWVRSHHPEFCHGNRHSPDASIGTLIAALSSTDTRELMTFATALRRALIRRGGEPLARLDEFLDIVQTPTAMLGRFGGMGGAALPSYGGAPSYAPHSPIQSLPQASVLSPEGQSGNGIHSSNPFEHFDSHQKSS